MFPGIANTAVSFSGTNIILNSNKSNNIYFSAKASTFLIVDLPLGNLFWAKYIFEIGTNQISCLHIFYCNG